MEPNTQHTEFLPVSVREMEALGWDEVDVVLVTGDAYVDHPSFGVALIGRLLASRGYRVAVLPQPRWDSPEDFRRFGRPRLFFGISAGNLDSIVANYSGNARVRERDDYSPGGNPYFGDLAERALRRRPDRASLLYANLARAAFAGVPVVLGGLEASLRRFVHYDYQQQRLRASLLTDAKADLLVYGMGERAVLEVAARLARGQGLAFIPGTCERLNERELAERAGRERLQLPSWSEIRGDAARFLAAELMVDQHARACETTPVLQRQQALWLWQNEPAAPLDTEELDALYALPFQRKAHPAMGDVPALRMIRDSLTIVRGCCGNCSFCAISRHQGPVVTSRSRESVLAEARALAESRDFSGTISDLGGPTANLFGTSCRNSAPCRRHDCLYPKVCGFLRIDEKAFLDLLDAVAGIKGVRHLFVSSGLRMELLLRTPLLLRRLLGFHTPGVLKIAPEHTEPEVLRLMHKPGPEILREFLRAARGIAREQGGRLRLSPYLIASHPGCTRQDMERMAATLENLDLEARQFQDFTPTPGTIATAMYVSGLDRDSRRPIHVARGEAERRKQRQALEGIMPGAPSGRRRGKPRGRARGARRLKKG